jgi:chemotaxis protein histidine kinase CheA
MNLPTEPRLPKTPFILTDVACLLAAALIGFYAKDPFAPLPFLSAVALVAAGGVALLVPFLADYGADCRESAREQHHQLELQIKRLHAAGESLTRAAAQIKAVEEAAHKSAHAAENLPYRMQEKLAEFNESLAEKEADDREALEQELTELRAANSDQLKAVADKIQKAAAEWSALEAAARKQLAVAQEATARLEKRISAAVAQLAHAAPATSFAEEKSAEPSAETAPAESPAVEESVSTSEPTAPAEPRKLKKPRAPRKPKVEEPAAADAPASAAAAESEPAVTPRLPDLTTFPVAMGDLSRSESAESSASSDGATRLLATAYIGIGNKLFIRGDGPGLSWDTGVPMQFVSIGKWGWATHDATAPIRAKLYKNDETAALSGEITLEPNRHTEVTALF